MYLRKMGSVSLLTREGEVEIAKRIEEGERQVLKAVLRSTIAVDELCEVGDSLKRAEIRVKEVVKDIDEEEVDFDEQWHVDRVVKVLEKVRKFHKENQKLLEQLAQRGMLESKRKALRESLEKGRQSIIDTLSDLRLQKNTVDRIVGNLKTVVYKVQRAELEIRNVERRCGLCAKDVRKALRAKKNGEPLPGRRRNLTLIDLEDFDRTIKMAHKRLKSIEEEATSASQTSPSLPTQSPSVKPWQSAPSPSS